MRDWFASKEKALDDVYHKSALRYKPDEEAIKALLLHCLEEHYGSLANAVVIDRTAGLTAEVEAVLDRYR